MNLIPDSIELKPSTNRTIISTFIGLELSGAIGMVIILFTAIFSHKVKRLATWYTFCASWTISCLSYSLLFFTGEIHLPEPRKSICVAQAALIYSVPTLTASSTLTLLVHSWYNVHFGLSKPPLESNSRVIMAMLLAPFLLWILLLIGFLSLGIKTPSLVHNFGLYCTFMQVLPAKISSLFVIITTFSTIPIQGAYMHIFAYTLHWQGVCITQASFTSQYLLDYRPAETLIVATLAARCPCKLSRW
ncbi:hypothetical protein J3R30DRAFT_3553498 [Lentinula aciculospora]|uniref:Uncharacterized protein n=1 Tax=Lentinula aciculospora TaxID=153920 RepID=A0A9W9DH18_9AGAR|nr:hypothetical protein J3R30DRAFT_3553498 [Lentinula aciculospora]